jgi:hypothetical protein
MARYKSNQEWKDWTTLALRDSINRQRLTGLPWARVHVRYIFHYQRVTAADPDNLIGSMKPCLDALKGEAIIDDSWKYIHDLSVRVEVVKDKPAGVRVVVTTCECAPD